MLKTQSQIKLATAAARPVRPLITNTVRQEDSDSDIEIFDEKPKEWRDPIHSAKKRKKQEQSNDLDKSGDRRSSRLRRPPRRPEVG